MADAAPLPAAYCAPGREGIARLALAARGERVAGVAGHPWLRGRADVMLVAPPKDWPPLEFEFPPVCLGRECSC